MRQVRVPTLTELGRITAVIVALIAFSALVAVAPSKVLIPLGVAFAAGLAASAVVALVGRYPRAIAAPITVPDASAHGTPPHSS
jgi:membrane protease YdiL (CAAX protease family)